LFSFLWRCYKILRPDVKNAATRGFLLSEPSPTRATPSLFLQPGCPSCYPTDSVGARYYINLYSSTSDGTTDGIRNVIIHRRAAHEYKNSSGDEIANVNFLRLHRTRTGQRLCPLNRLRNFYYKYLC